MKLYIMCIKSAAQKVQGPNYMSCAAQKQVNVTQIGLQDHLIHPTKTPSLNSFLQNQPSMVTDVNRQASWPVY